MTMTVAVSSQNGFTGAVALTCSVTGPSGAQDIPTCSFNPGNVSVVDAGDAGVAVESVLTINSTAPSSAAVKKAGRQAWGTVGGATLACVLLGFLPKRRSPKQVVLLLFCLLLTFGLSSCGGGGGGGGSTTAPTGAGGAGSGNPGTTAGNYKVTFTATSGSITATTTPRLSLLTKALLIVTDRESMSGTVCGSSNSNMPAATVLSLTDADS
jgi:hypothetical protein